MEDEKVVTMPSSAAARDRVHVRACPLEIYLVGRDAEILRRRERILAGQSELAVRSMMPDEAEKRVRDTEPRLWIFCHTMDLGRLVHLACCVRRHSPASRLVLMEGRRPPGFEASLFHQIVPVINRVKLLIDTVSHLAVVV